MNTANAQDIQLQIREGVAVITLNRPKTRNALDAAMAQQLIDVCDTVDRDHTVGAAVVRGAGGTFCSGANRAVLDTAGQDPASEENFAALGAVYESFYRVGHLAVPVIAAVRGAAVGAGINLVLAADLRVIAQDARLIAGFLRIGLHPGGGNFKLTALRANRETAAALSLFGEEIDGRRAREIGLAWDAPADQEVEDRALKLAARAARDPELARKAVKSFRALTDSGVDWRIALEAERSAQMWSLRRRAAGDTDGKADGR